MKFSKAWLQDYIVETLPDDVAIRDVLNKKAFEVEEVISTPSDTVLDIKVLPNRAHDALGHRGMARELCADFGYTFKDDARTRAYDEDDKTVIPGIAIDDATACTRFMSMRIDGVKVGESPAWLKARLEALGQRSINNIVDVTNYVQFSLNKPMHAYDSRSIAGVIRARFAKKGETLTTLDDKELKLDTATLVIADDEKVLGLAGIKGGKFSGIQKDTTSVIIESANFEPSLIRKTAQKYDIRTDASKRFENGIASILVEEGLYMTAHLIKELFPKAKLSHHVDVYPLPERICTLSVTRSDINAVLGTDFTDNHVETALNKLLFSWKKLIPEEEILLEAHRLEGSPYHLHAELGVTTMFDCSSLTSFLAASVGITLPRMSVDQYVFTERSSDTELQVGDLIFANNDEDPVYTSSLNFLPGTVVPQGINHVGMYLGDGNVIHATKMYGKVVIENLGVAPRFQHITGYGRIMSNPKEERYVIEVPAERLDIRIKEDLVEEVGRIIGYDTLVPTLPKLTRIGLLHKRAQYENKIREILLEQGFSEVMTYTFGDEGEVELVKGLADDKEKLRTSLGKGMLQSLALNLYNAPLLGQKTVKIFEFGNVFTHDTETRHLAIALDDGAKKSSFTEEVDMILAGIKRALGVHTIECTTISAKPYAIEIDFDTLIATLEESPSYEAPSFATLPVVSYVPVSTYPFIARDIAMWVSDSTTWESIYALCNEVGNTLVARIDLFDTFSKEIDGVRKTSYAFRLVFQSYEKTLTDEEVNHMMEPYYAVFKQKGYEIR